MAVLACVTDGWSYYPVVWFIPMFFVWEADLIDILFVGLGLTRLAMMKYNNDIRLFNRKFKTIKAEAYELEGNRYTFQWIGYQNLQILGVDLELINRFTLSTAEVEDISEMVRI